MRVIIAGGRDITNYEKLVRTIEQSGIPITEVVSGMAKGVDLMGEWYAKQNNIPIRQFPAEWDKFGRSAGFIRNAQMANYADACILLWDGYSKGTAHMLNLARDRDLKVFVEYANEEDKL